MVERLMRADRVVQRSLRTLTGPGIANSFTDSIHGSAFWFVSMRRSTRQIALFSAAR